jgi:hypothetical protein
VLAPPLQQLLRALERVAAARRLSRLGLRARYERRASLSRRACMLAQ